MFSSETLANYLATFYIDILFRFTIDRDGMKFLFIFSSFSLSPNCTNCLCVSKVKLITIIYNLKFEFIVYYYLMIHLLTTGTLFQHLREYWVTEDKSRKTRRRI